MDEANDVDHKREKNISVCRIMERKIDFFSRLAALWKNKGCERLPSAQENAEKEYVITALFAYTMSLSV